MVTPPVFDTQRFFVVRYDENGPHDPEAYDTLVEYIYQCSKVLAEGINKRTNNIINISPWRVETLSGLIHGVHKIIYDGKIIGVIAGNEYLGDWVNIRTFYIDPLYRSQGFGTLALRRYMDAVSQERKKKSFSITIHDDSSDLMNRFYRFLDRSGFTHVSSTRFVTDKELSSVKSDNDLSICRMVSDEYVQRLCVDHVARTQPEKENVKIKVTALKKTKNCEIIGIRKGGSLVGCMIIHASKRYCTASTIALEEYLEREDILHCVKLVAADLKKKYGCKMKDPYGIVLHIQNNDDYLSSITDGIRMQKSYLITV